MRVCVFEDAGVANLEPLTLTRPAFDLLCGASSLLGRQCRHFGATEVGALVRQALDGLCRQAHPDVAVNDPAWLRGGRAVLVNARWLAPAEAATDLDAPRAALDGDQLAYAVLPPGGLGDVAPEAIEESLGRLRAGLPPAAAGGRVLDYPWDLVTHNTEALARDVPPDGPGARPPVPAGLTVIGPAERLFIDPSARVEPLTVADTTGGPILLDREVLVRAYSRLEGPCYVGPGTWLLAAKVSGSSIGPVCRVGGAVEVSVVQGYTNKAHEGFLGHAYLGEWVNLGAGTQVSDLRTDYRPVVMSVGGRRVDTGLTKVGAFLGDHTKTGINALLNTGTSAGAFCHIYPSSLLPPRDIPSFCSFARGRLEEGPGLEQLLATADTAMRRRGRGLSAAEADFYRRLHGRTAWQRQQALREGPPRGRPGADSPPAAERR